MQITDLRFVTPAKTTVAAGSDSALAVTPLGLRYNLTTNLQVIGQATSMCDEEVMDEVNLTDDEKSDYNASAQVLTYFKRRIHTAVSEDDLFDAADKLEELQKDINKLQNPFNDAMYLWRDRKAHARR